MDMVYFFLVTMCDILRTYTVIEIVNEIEYNFRWEFWECEINFPPLVANIEYVCFLSPTTASNINRALLPVMRRVQI